MNRKHIIRGHAYSHATLHGRMGNRLTSPCDPYYSYTFIADTDLLPSCDTVVRLQDVSENTNDDMSAIFFTSFHARINP